jgi:hypothetical protein
MEVSHPTPARLQLLLKTVGFSTMVMTGKPAAMKVTLDCPRGRVEFRS